jgi:hypothetical protein
MISAYGIEPAFAREVVIKAMLKEQPLPLRGRTVDGSGSAAYIARP